MYGQAVCAGGSVGAAAAGGAGQLSFAGCSNEGGKKLNMTNEEGKKRSVSRD